MRITFYLTAITMIAFEIFQIFQIFNTDFSLFIKFVLFMVHILCFYTWMYLLIKKIIKQSYETTINDRICVG